MSNMIKCSVSCKVYPTIVVNGKHVDSQVECMKTEKKRI